MAVKASKWMDNVIRLHDIDCGQSTHSNSIKTTDAMLRRHTLSSVKTHFHRKKADIRDEKAGAPQRRTLYNRARVAAEPSACRCVLEKCPASGSPFRP